MWKAGDKLIIIRFCDSRDNQEILGKVLTVVQDSSKLSPNWTEVEYDGKQYTVRGAEARRA